MLTFQDIYQLSRETTLKQIEMIEAYSKICQVGKSKANQSKIMKELHSAIKEDVKSKLENTNGELMMLEKIVKKIDDRIFNNMQGGK